MILFAQSFYGEVKKWFKGLTTRRIHDFQQFETYFLRKLERKKNSLHLLTQYNNLKRGPIEFMQEFSTRFMRTYDSILADVKPPPGATKLHYVDDFSSEFTLLLRERRFVSLKDMMDDSIELEVNLIASNKTKQINETRRVKEEEPQASTSQSSLDAKFNMMIKTMEKLMDKLFADDKNQMKNQNEPQARNPNFKRQQGPPVPQVMTRGKRNPKEHQIRPSF
jgi:hypothetical protein